MKRVMRFCLTMVVLFCCLLKLSAETTGSNITRNITVDGNVTLTNSVGANTSDWEPDEVLEGMNASINWHLSWDDAFVYIGKIGGNNVHGSLIFIRADHGTGLFSDAVDTMYDGFAPDFTNMEGINFVAYLNDSYNEYRTFNGTTWNETTNTMNPAFSDQSGIDHMEVKIAWDDITDGNGKPDNIRIVFYQVEEFASACGGNFYSYGESPWGTGALNDGPSVAVNDGVATSAEQPAGCGTANAVVTRWWGCYPVIGGVGLNDWIPKPPDAGEDANICAAEHRLNGNTPSAEAIGTWKVVDKPTGAADPIFADINDPDVTVEGLKPGTYVLEWSIDYGNCPSNPDSLVIRVAEPLKSSIREVGLPNENNRNGSVTIVDPTGGFPPYFTSLDSADFNEAKFTYEDLEAGVYTIYVSDELGCMLSFPFEILNIPTGFSPNGDGNNDTWMLSGLDQYVNARFEIYSAWGKLVHQGSVESGFASWDGNWNGNPAPEANYYYMIYFEDGTLLKGSITLIR